MFSGTLGAVLDEVNGKRRFLLSNNHVMAVNGRVPVNSYIVSPGPEDGPGMNPKSIGTFLDCIVLKHNENNYVDCAVAELIDGSVSAKLPNGSTVTYYGQQSDRRSVYKFGKSTGLTTGKAVDFHADILVDYSFGTFRFVDQILIDGGSTDFAADGDSGSLVVADLNGSNPSAGTSTDTSVRMVEAMGLVFAPAGRYTAVCPISKVLDALERKLDISLRFSPQ
jgi:hypothetical protein